MGKTCFDCGKKLGFGDVKISGSDMQKNKSKCGFTDELIERMTEKDVLCVDCKQKYSIRHALEIYNCIKKNNSAKDFESCRNDEYLQPIIIEAERLLAEQNKEEEII